MEGVTETLITYTIPNIDDSVRKIDYLFQHFTPGLDSLKLAVVQVSHHLCHGNNISNIYYSE